MILEKCVIGIEFGSTNIKAVMLDENHEIIASNDYSWESTLCNGIWIYTIEQAKIGLADCYAGLKKKFETKYRKPLSKVGAIAQMLKTNYPHYLTLTSHNVGAFLIFIKLFLTEKKKLKILSLLPH